MDKRGDFFKNPYTIVLTILVLIVFLIMLTLIFKPAIQEEELTEIVEEKAVCEFCNNIRETNAIAVTGNIEECNSLSTPESIEFCRISLIMDKAMSEKDSAICNQLPEEKITNCKDNVLLLKALEIQDKNLCNDIINEDTKNVCLNLI